MQRAFHIHQPHHISDYMLARMVERQLIPLSGIESKWDLKYTLNDHLQNMDAHTLSEKEMLSIIKVQNIKTGDWIAVTNHSGVAVLFAKTLNYENIENLHLYIKHFIRFSHIVFVYATPLSSIVQKDLVAVPHLEQAGYATERVVNDFERELKKFRYKPVCFIKYKKGTKTKKRQSAKNKYAYLSSSPKHHYVTTIPGATTIVAGKVHTIGKRIKK